MTEPTTPQLTKESLITLILSAIEHALVCFAGQPNRGSMFIHMLANELEEYDSRLSNQLRQLIAPTQAAPAPAEQPPALIYPAEITPELTKILSLMVWKSGQLAQVYRAAGEPIGQGAEAEQCFMFDRMIKLALRHGAEWHAIFQDELTKMIALAQQREEVKA